MDTLDAFDGIWRSLFESPVHLDSALSKQEKGLKTLLAQIVPPILLRPVSLAQSLGVGVAIGEPWKLEGPALGAWRPARLIARGMHQAMSGKLPAAEPVPEDFPPWFLEEIEKDWGSDVLKTLVEVLGREAPLALRASVRLGAAGLLKELNSPVALPVKAELSAFAPCGVRLGGYTPVLKTAAYERGDFEIQDEGSQLMALFALWPERYGHCVQDAPGRIRAGVRSEPVPTNCPPLTVVDACAGAGGKSLALGDAMGGKGRLYAYDTSKTKLSALKRRASRAGLRSIQAVEVQNGQESAVVGKFEHTADVVLVDAPCSGWGVLRRNPDIKWRQDAAARSRMPEIQLRLLETYSALVKPGGRLVFGVCTFRREETRGVVESFSARHPEFEAREGGFVGPGPSDGFFMQAFTRR